MANVVSIKFKNHGKSYFFDPGELRVSSGDKVIVETSKGLEIADCCYGNHEVPDTAVVQPLRPVIRIADAQDLKTAEANSKREIEAFGICRQKIADHGLDMKLVDVECSFEGNKILFFFTSDGRVDFRELVKDLASVFHSRIELRQIGVRDEAKMLGGIAICGRPYCCNQFLDAFQPVSTKMAKIQSLSLNPTKISGSCGRLMCCLRYEQDAYEDLLKTVPKQGAFVQTKDGYGTAVQVDLLRQSVKVKLDSDTDETLRLYKANELAVVPGGRPKDGETPENVFTYVPPIEEEEENVPEDDWKFYEDEDGSKSGKPVETLEVPVSKVRDGRRQRRPKDKDRPRREKPENSEKSEAAPKSQKPPKNEKPRRSEKPPRPEKNADAEKPEKPVKAERPEKKDHPPKRRPKSASETNGEKQEDRSPRPTNKPQREHREPKESKETREPKEPRESGSPKPHNHRRRYYHSKPGGGAKPGGAE